jgi:hypothetical protein
MPASAMALGTRKLTLEEMELSRLRAENLRLKREVEILTDVTQETLKLLDTLFRRKSFLLPPIK